MICTGSGLDLTAKNEENRKYLETWFANLPPQEQNNLQNEFSRLSNDASIQDYLNLVTKMIPQEPGFLRKIEMFFPYCSNRITWDCSSCYTGEYFQKREGKLLKRKRQTLDEAPKRPKFDLRNQIDQKKEPAPRKTEQELNQLKKEGKCFKCGLHWSPKDHKCPPRIPNRQLLQH
jgi:hypothetical protein